MPAIKDGMPGPGRLLSNVILSGIALLAFALRALPWRNFLGMHGEYLFYGPDSYDHLRRITLGMAQFPRVPSFDSYYGFPRGTGQIWSPLFDYLLSILALIFGMGQAEVGTAHWLGFWLSPVLAAVTVVLVMLTARYLYGGAAALLAALVVALLPGHILYSFVSELDHHVAEPIVCLALCLALLRGERRLRAACHHWTDALVIGFWLVFAIMIWRGAVIFWSVALFALLLHCCLAAWHGRPTMPLAYLGRNASLWGMLLLLPLCMMNVWHTAGGMTFGIVSWFHILLLGAAAVVFEVTARLPAYGGRLGWRLAAGLLALAVLLLLLPWGRTFVTELFSGLAVIGGTDPWLDSIAELRPMLFPNRVLDLWHATETLSLLYWLYPVLVAVMCWRGRHGAFKSFPQTLFLVWGGIFWVLPLFRERYVHLTAITLALGAGYMAEYLREAFGNLGRKMSVVVVFGLVGLTLVPSAGFWTGIPQAGLVAYEKHDLPETLTWLRDKTPVPGIFSRPAAVPQYGVLSEWGLGAYVDYVAQRPTVATNFGWETHGLYESTTFLTQTDLAAARQILLANKVRYLLLSNVTGSLEQFWKISESGRQTGRYRQPGTSAQFKPFATMFYRLYIQDGSAFSLGGADFDASGNYRLVHESPGTFVDPLVGPVSYYKVFELVSGASLHGVGPAGTKAELALKLRSDTGREFTYRDVTTIDNSGKFIFSVPYPSSGRVGDVQAVGPCLLKVGGRLQSVDIREEDVTQGKSVQIFKRS